MFCPYLIRRHVHINTRVSVITTQWIHESTFLNVRLDCSFSNCGCGKTRGGPELNYAGSGQLNQAEDSASRVSVMCSQNLFLCFEENWERLSEKECQLAVCQPPIHTYQVPLCENGEKAFCFSGCTFEWWKICPWKLADMFFPSSYRSSEEATLPSLLALLVCFLLVCATDVAVGFTCTGVGEAVVFLPLHVQLGASWGRSAVLP